MCNFLQILCAIQHLKHYTAVRALQLLCTISEKPSFTSPSILFTGQIAKQIYRGMKNAKTFIFLNTNPQATETFVTFFLSPMTPNFARFEEIEKQKGQKSSRRQASILSLVKLITILNT